MLLNSIRRRVNSVVGAAIAAVFFLLCGAILAFVISPQQALEWRRIESLPVLDAAGYAAVGSGQEVAMTGTLEDNAALTEDGMVAYVRERWDVEPPDPDVEDDQPHGTWNTVERVAPALKLAVEGGSISTLAAEGPTFGGQLHETLEPGTGELTATDNSQPLVDGSLRTRGFVDGDLVTVVGHKGSRPAT